jgi:hypothetical protein
VLSEVARPDFLSHVQVMGRYLSKRLTALSAELGLGAERGIGLLLDAPRSAVLRFMPSLVVSRGEIDQMIGRPAPPSSAHPGSGPRSLTAPGCPPRERAGYGRSTRCPEIVTITDALLMPLLRSMMAEISPSPPPTEYRRIGWLAV